MATYLADHQSAPQALFTELDYAAVQHQCPTGISTVSIDDWLRIVTMLISSVTHVYHYSDSESEVRLSSMHCTNILIFNFDTERVIFPLFTIGGDGKNLFGKV